VRAASDHPVDREQAERIFHQAIDEARRIGFVSEEFDARLGLAELEYSSGKTANSREQLTALHKEATQRGWLFFANKAAAVLKTLG
jgi:hypothetical protein